MPKATVQSVKFNVQKTSKGGKAYTVTELKFCSEKGQVKTEAIFTNATFHPVVQTLAAGDEINVSYTKNGEHFNVSNIELISKGTGVSPLSDATIPPAPQAGSTFKPRTENPEVQASIQRQNALTNATNLVAKMLEMEMFKKTTKATILVDEIISIATAFEGYTSGTRQEKALESIIPSVTPSGSDDAPFDTGEFPE